MTGFREARWDNPEMFKIGSKSFKCGYCSKEVGSETGFNSNINSIGNIHICPICRQPTYFDYSGNQIPAPIFGNTVEHLPKDIKELYDEARRCMQVNAFTSSVMACRKLLMHIAVERGADENKSFVEYVNYLEKNHFTPPNGKDWVDHIRTQGNEANHEIALKIREDAIDLINFIEMLLKFIYEFPGKIKSKKAVKK